MYIPVYHHMRNIVITYETHCDIRHWNIDTRVVSHVVVEFSLSSSSIYDCCSWRMYLLGGIHSCVRLMFGYFQHSHMYFRFVGRITLDLLYSCYPHTSRFHQTRAPSCGITRSTEFRCGEESSIRFHSVPEQIKLISS